MQKKFRGVLEESEAGHGAVFVRVPFDPEKVWPERIGLRVQGVIQAAKATREGRDGKERAPFSFRSSLFHPRDSGYRLMINQSMQKAARVSVGSIVEVLLEPDLQKRSAAAPPALEKLLQQDPRLRAWYAELAYSTRKDIATHLREPKSAEARERRAEQFAERMMLAMDGEEKTPPVLEVAFQQQPLARNGWLAMTAKQRRAHLLAIFGCQSVEARARKTAKAVTEALDVARKKASSPGAAHFAEPHSPDSSRRRTGDRRRANGTLLETGDEEKE